VREHHSFTPVEFLKDG
jgi:hypothetical protein